jgi:pantothenate kinase
VQHPKFKLNSLDQLTKLLLKKIKSNQSNRLMVCIAGAPGSGKSYISSYLLKKINFIRRQSEIFEMDGFHYDDVILKKKKLIKRKGSQQTFDVMGLKSFLQRLKTNNEVQVTVPIFDRKLELSRGSAKIIKNTIPLIITEGNYLLLKQKPWSELQSYFDLTIMIKSSQKNLSKRLTERWKSFNYSKDIIKQKVFENDLPNARYVYENSIKADIEFTN